MKVSTTFGSLKHLLTYTLLISILAATAAKSVIWVSFIIHRDYIAKELCIEKDVANSCCKGSCVLTKELAKTEAGSNGPKWESVREIILFFQNSSLPLPQQFSEINSFYSFNTNPSLLLLDLRETPPPSIC